jgi:hypothetical protein
MRGFDYANFRLVFPALLIALSWTAGAASKEEAGDALWLLKPVVGPPGAAGGTCTPHPNAPILTAQV